MKLRIAFLLLLVSLKPAAQEKNSTGISLVPVPAGTFWMGSEGKGTDYDEAPVHKVTISRPFLMSKTEITNAQYEQFDPSHRAYRGKAGFSSGDNEAVVFVNYHDALAFCQWLSEKEGRTYRLPTEAEWEYACRAGSLYPYFTGVSLPEIYHKNQRAARNPTPVDLTVGQTPSNAFGLCDMHGNVEEWCLDWYALYDEKTAVDPAGAQTGLYRITRGGSHNTPAGFLRSASRMAMIPEDKHWLTGFRIVQADYPATPAYSLPQPAPDCMLNVSQKKYAWKAPAENAFFKEPLVFVNPPDCDSGTPFYDHNHCPAITWCKNGDLLAIWFSANAESGREMVILGSRLRAGSEMWDKASLFFKVPDRNMTGSCLFIDSDGTLIHTNGVEAAGDWQNLAIAMRTSRDNGATWSAPRLIAPEHTAGNQVIAGMIKTAEGRLIQAADASPESNGGTAIHISNDGGKTWNTPGIGNENRFVEGGQGGIIAGIHAGIVQLKNGNLMALGRGDAIVDAGGLQRMPMSISTDMGQTWHYSASEFPPIDGGQRLVLARLNEGAILLVSFTHHPFRIKDGQSGMTFIDSEGKSFEGRGMYAAVSFDEGKTWTKKLLTDGKERFLNGGAWTGFFKTDSTHAEPQGYLAICQTPDNEIHLLSSCIHYRFNLQWLVE